MVEIFSGNCFTVGPVAQMNTHVMDSTIRLSTYLGPDFLTLHPLNNKKVIVSDWYRIRGLDLDNDKVITLCERKVAILSEFRFHEVLVDILQSIPSSLKGHVEQTILL